MMSIIQGIPSGDLTVFGSKPLRGFDFFQETKEDIVCYKIMLVTNKRL